MPRLIIIIAAVALPRNHKSPPLFRLFCHWNHCGGTAFQLYHRLPRTDQISPGTIVYSSCNNWKKAVSKDEIPMRLRQDYRRGALIIKTWQWEERPHEWGEQLITINSDQKSGIVQSSLKSATYESSYGRSSSSAQGGRNYYLATFILCITLHSFHNNSSKISDKIFI